MGEGEVIGEGEEVAVKVGVGVIEGEGVTELNVVDNPTYAAIDATRITTIPIVR